MGFLPCPALPCPTMLMQGQFWNVCNPMALHEHGWAEQGRAGQDRAAPGIPDNQGRTMKGDLSKVIEQDSQ